MLNYIINDQKSLLKFVINMHFYDFHKLISNNVMHIGGLRINFNKISISPNSLSLFSPVLLLVP